MKTDEKFDPNSFRRIEELIEHFEKAKGFTEELLKENERLRMRIVKFESTASNDERSDKSADIGTLEEENRKLKEKLRAFESKFLEVEKENKDFADKYVQIQTTNDNLMNLYVSSYQLHSTLDPEEVVKVIEEIIINLIGAEYFDVYMLDQNKKKFRIVAGESPEGPIRNKSINELDPVLESVFKTGKAYFKEKNQKDSLYLACTPLKVKDEIVGIITINTLLPQKKSGFTSVDYELLSLLADHAATALLSSNLYSKTERKLKTVQSFMELLKIDKK